MTVSSWLSLGPIGTVALGVPLFGEHAQRILLNGPMSAVDAAAHGASIAGASILRGYGMWWLVLAVLITLRYMREGLPFNMGWWAFTFPNGVFR